MSAVGILQKMPAYVNGREVHYRLIIGTEEIALNPYIGQRISLNYSGEIFCIYCGRKTKKSWSQGFCYPCSQNLARCDMCIVRPERCHYHLGTCREPAWGLEHCFKPHIIYLANASGVKVGITRAKNIPQRWLDQGAIQALPILAVQSRINAGKLEVAMAQFVADKTNWRAMLKNETKPQNLAAESSRLLAKITPLIAQCNAEVLNQEMLTFNYPVIQYPTKILSLNFDKTPLIEGELMGIKGQYLLLSSGVINIRKFSGYRVEFN